MSSIQVLKLPVDSTTSNRTKIVITLSKPSAFNPSRFVPSWTIDFYRLPYYASIIGRVGDGRYHNLKTADQKLMHLLDNLLDAETIKQDQIFALAINTKIKELMKHE